ncbi:hypothetical protein M513_08040, partial [Trichuris suis]
MVKILCYESNLRLRKIKAALYISYNTTFNGDFRDVSIISSKLTPLTIALSYSLCHIQNMELDGFYNLNYEKEQVDKKMNMMKLLTDEKNSYQVTRCGRRCIGCFLFSSYLMRRKIHVFTLKRGAPSRTAQQSQFFFFRKWFPFPSYKEIAFSSKKRSGILMGVAWGRRKEYTYIIIV